MTKMMFGALAALALGLPSAGLAQPTPPPHQHGQPPAAASPAQAHQQHQATTGAELGTRSQAPHPEGCSCPCCEMMRQMMTHMMQRHGRSGGMQGMQHETPPAAEQQEHQDHQQPQPN